MTIFYTDSGSFNSLSVTGSSTISGSLIISGRMQGDVSVVFNNGLTVTGSTILNGPLTVTGSTGTGSFGYVSVVDPIEVDRGNINIGFSKISSNGASNSELNLLANGYGVVNIGSILDGTLLQVGDVDFGNGISALGVFITDLIPYSNLFGPAPSIGTIAAPWYTGSFKTLRVSSSVSASSFTSSLVNQVGFLGTSSFAATASFVNNDIGVLNVAIVRSGSLITTGYKTTVNIPSNCFLEKIRMMSDTSGSIQLDIRGNTYAGWSPNPLNGTSITSSTVPLSMSNAVKFENSTLTNWDRNFATDEMLNFVVVAASGSANFNQVMVSMFLRRV